MKDHVLVSVRLLVVFTLLLGFGYPAAVWAVGRVAFPGAAGGSFVSRDGKVVGSALIGQAVTSPGLFRTRPSAAGERLRRRGLGRLEPRPDVEGSRRPGRRRRSRRPAPRTPARRARPGRRRHRLGLRPRPARLARLRALAGAARREGDAGSPRPTSRRMVARRTEGRFLGLFGEPRVNVLLLNLDVSHEARSSRPPSP